MFRKFFFTLGQIYQSWLAALESVVINKLRTGLSLGGVTIGIFAIITVFTLVDSMTLHIRQGIESLGSNTLYVSKWPWEGGGEWWKYSNRPQVSLDEYRETQALLPQAEVAFMTSFNRTARHGSLYVDNATVLCVSHNYDRIQTTEINQGRYFTPFESAHGSRVAILGPEIAEQLFDGSDPVGKTIRIGDIKLHVIGLLAKAGNSVAFNSLDRSILIPLSLTGNFINLRWAPTDMIITGPDGTDMENLKAEVSSIMRRLRRLSPQTEDNFALNEVSIMNNIFDEMYRKINLAGGIIGLFSILVGGFGVANIMFVTVRERIVQIGIQKALGARPYFILCQFLFEAMILSVIGGAIGLAMVYIGTLLVNHFSNFTLVLTFSNILLGLTIASIVGAVAGLFPAWSAARMDPVQAISHT